MAAYSTVQYNTILYRQPSPPDQFNQFFTALLFKTIRNPVKNWLNWSDCPKHCKKLVILVKLVFPKPPYSCGVQYSTVQHSTLQYCTVLYAATVWRLGKYQFDQFNQFLQCFGKSAKFNQFFTMVSDGVK